MGFRSKKTSDAGVLYEYAVGALGRKMRSVAELKRLLRQRVAAGDQGEALVEAVIIKLKEQKYLNDASYAAAYSTYRKENERFGRMRVIADLKAKGVHGEVIDKAVSAAYAGSDEEQLARAYLRRKNLRKPTDEKQAARIFRSLRRAGFTSRTIIRILKNWHVDDEVLTALESEEQSG
ncbi:MAG TPA: regulatory protein RecX [Terriglobales bacterium]|nr:regulatory protein RecX [Terriglobales bacterium]